MFCKHCGEKLNPESRYCKRCGVPRTTPQLDATATRSSTVEQRQPNESTPLAEAHDGTTGGALRSPRTLAISSQAAGLTSRKRDVVLAVLAGLLVGGVGGALYYSHSRVSTSNPSSSSTGPSAAGDKSNPIGDSVPPGQLPGVGQGGPPSPPGVEPRGDVNPATPESNRAAAPSIARAAIKDGGTSLELSPGRVCLYGMATGGAASSSPFSAGQFAAAVDKADQLAAALAYGPGERNEYTTATGYHVIGGTCVNGEWDSFNASYGANSDAGASSASVSITVPTDALVVVIGLAASQQEVVLSGIPGMHVDASNSGPGASEGMVIAHANLMPGTYNVTERSRALSGGQDPQHMADLLGVFVFAHKQTASVTQSHQIEARNASRAQQLSWYWDYNPRWQGRLATERINVRQLDVYSLRFRRNNENPT
jgi:hypothetical protein